MRRHWNLNVNRNPATNTPSILQALDYKARWLLQTESANSDDLQMNGFQAQNRKSIESVPEMVPGEVYRQSFWGLKPTASQIIRDPV